MGLGARLDHHELAPFFLQRDHFAIDNKRRGNSALPFFPPLDFTICDVHTQMVLTTREINVSLINNRAGLRAARIQRQFP